MTFMNVTKSHSFSPASSSVKTDQIDSDLLGTARNAPQTSLRRVIQSCDFLVIGSGLAGLAFALKVAEHGRVIILSKAHAPETNTSMAQGGIAAVMGDDDSFESHIKDTLVAGAGLCKESIVRIVV
jgi:heterodisulfide reductase subunit A-like polyferredoxin